MADYGTKQGDTDPLEVELISDHAPTWTLDGTVFIIVTTSKGQKIIDRAPCEIISPTEHTVRYRWNPTQTKDAGLFKIEFENIDSQGAIRTFPSGINDEPDYTEMQIVKQLG